MKNYKTTFRMYPAWNYVREIEDLNKLSEQGWQLYRGGMFISKFERNSNVRYRYQLDYQPKVEDRVRYIESHREFGWEYINATGNGWHYFRKPYDPSLPEEDYELFSDRSSLREMNSRWTKLATGLLVFVCIVLAIELVLMILHPMLPTLVIVLEYVLLLFMLIRGVRVMKDPDHKKNGRGDGVLIAAVLFGALFCLFASLFMADSRPVGSSMSAEYMDPVSAQRDEAMLWNTVDVRYPDFYYFDTAVEAENPITISVVDESDNVVYAATGDRFTEEDTGVYLNRGEYRIYISDFAGGAVNLELDID